MSSSEPRGPRLSEGWPLTIAIGLLLLAAWAATLAVFGTSEAGWRTLVRNSARCTLTLFLLVFPASALARRFSRPATRWLARNRRYLGVGLAISHFLHLGAIFGLYGLALFQVRSPLSLAVGAVPYTLLGLMAATSSDRAVRALGARRWRALHLLGMHVLFVAFLTAYVGRTVQDPRHLPIVLLLVGELVLRLRTPRGPQ
jgi:DMSO/TMAO reductase YedYZ heme-binding membrane subunit